jgi:uncharacterized SAM-binding protein YcdF (DUF218 family)
LAVIAALLFWKPLLSALGNALVEDDGVRKAQAAVVLGGDGHGVRIITAAQLAQAGYVPYVIVDGPKTLLGYESDMNIPYAEQRGYAAALFRALKLPADVRSTQTEAEYVGQYLKKAGIHRILLVTSNFHTHRAAYLFRKFNPSLDVIAVPAADPDFKPDSWWTFQLGRDTFMLEWMKTVAAYLGI